MKVLVIGANGQVGKKLVKKLNDKNHEVIAMVRDEGQLGQFPNGVKTVLGDLEKDFSHAYKENLDAVVFAAGSGGDTPKEKTDTVDLQGARKSIDLAQKNHVDRYIMVSALGANNASEMPENMRHYFVAKSEADQHLAQTQLNYTIFRPGQLTDKPGTGNVNAAESLENREPRTTRRDDLATAIAVALDKTNTHKKVIEILDGDTPVNDAIAAI